MVKRVSEARTVTGRLRVVTRRFQGGYGVVTGWLWGGYGVALITGSIGPKNWPEGPPTRNLPGGA